MRLVPLLLMAGALGAQTPGRLPWLNVAALPWSAGDCAEVPADPPRLTPEDAGPLQVRITEDGVVRVVDDRGILLLRTGLPGRPVRVWRDGGVPVEDLKAPIAFPRTSPIARGIGALPVGAADFRTALRGLVWILADDSRVLTVIHPATARLTYLPLPGGRGFQLLFQTDHLGARETPNPEASPCWTLPWLALLPNLIQLGQENPANKPSGTALLPYPKS